MDAFLEGLKTEGRTDSEGCFTVDWARANTLLGQHLLSEPEDGVLKVVQACVRAGASRLHVSHLPGGLELAFDRPSLTAADLAALPGALLSPGSPLRDLALALHGTQVFEVRTPEGSARGNRELFVLRPGERGAQRVVLSTTRTVNLVKVAHRCPHPPLDLRLPVSQWCYAYPVAEIRHEGGGATSGCRALPRDCWSSFLPRTTSRSSPWASTATRGPRACGSRSPACAAGGNSPGGRPARWPTSRRTT